MSIAVLTALAVSTISQFQYNVPESAWNRLIAEPEPSITNVADDVHRPGFNGRIWEGRVTLGPRTHHWPTHQSQPGSLKYGAGMHNDAVMYARVGNLVVDLDPFQKLTGTGMENLEHARNLWLRRHGYTNGVRTFVNDRYRIHRDRRQASASRPEPRGILRIRPDMPKREGSLHVNATRVSHGVAMLKQTAQPVRISAPSSIDPAMLAAVRRNQAKKSMADSSQ